MTGEHEIPARGEEYQSYLLRLWRATCDGETTWRASLESPHTGERAGFASLEALFEHLQANPAPPSLDVPSGSSEQGPMPGSGTEEGGEH